MKKCPKCGTILDDSKKKCYMCGADLTITASVKEFSSNFDTSIGSTISRGSDNVFNNGTDIDVDSEDITSSKNNNGSFFSHSSSSKDFYHREISKLNSEQKENKKDKKKKGLFSRIKKDKKNKKEKKVEENNAQVKKITYSTKPKVPKEMEQSIIEKQLDDLKKLENGSNNFSSQDDGILRSSIKEQERREDLSNTIPNAFKNFNSFVHEDENTGDKKSIFDATKEDNISNEKIDNAFSMFNSNKRPKDTEQVLKEEFSENSNEPELPIITNENIETNEQKFSLFNKKQAESKASNEPKEKKENVFSKLNNKAQEFIEEKKIKQEIEKEEKAKEEKIKEELKKELKNELKKELEKEEKIKITNQEKETSNVVYYDKDSSESQKDIHNVTVNKEKPAINWGDNLKNRFDFRRKSPEEIKEIGRMIFNIASLVIFIIIVAFVYFKFIKADSRSELYGLQFTASDYFELTTKDSVSRFYTSKKLKNACAVRVTYGPDKTDPDNYADVFFSTIKDSFKNDKGAVVTKNEMKLNGNIWQSEKIVFLPTDGTEKKSSDIIPRYNYILMIYNTSVYTVSFNNNNEDSECDLQLNKFLNSLEFIEKNA